MDKKSKLDGNRSRLQTIGIIILAFIITSIIWIGVLVFIDLNHRVLDSRDHRAHRAALIDADLQKVELPHVFRYDVLDNRVVLVVKSLDGTENVAVILNPTGTGYKQQPYDLNYEIDKDFLYEQYAELEPTTGLKSHFK